MKKKSACTPEEWEAYKTDHRERYQNLDSLKKVQILWKAAKRYAELSPEEKETKRARKYAWNLRNKEKLAEQRRLRRKELDEKLRAAGTTIWHHRDKHYVYAPEKNKKRYGLTPQQRQDLRDLRGNKCFICDKPPAGKQILCIDHCHKTGRVRGALCIRCNTLVGWLETSQDLLSKVEAYLGT